MNIAFIGAGGNIAGAIINGILNSNIINPNQLFLFDPRAEQLNVFKKKGAFVCSSASEAVQKSDYVFLTVKPQVIFNVIEDFKNVFSIDKCIVTVAAGISIKSIKSAIGFDCKVVRVMPNTPLMVLEGASGISHEPPAMNNDIQLVTKIFNSAGISVLCDETQINTITAVSGSGPAYVFKFAKAIVEEAAELGLDKDKALKLICQTLIGSAHMLLESGKDAQELIDMVTSPKGTTLAAIESFDSNNFEDIIKAAVLACKNRADELGKSE